MRRALPVILLLSVLMLGLSFGFTASVEEQPFVAVIYLILLAPVCLALYRLTGPRIDVALPIILFSLALIWKLVGSLARFWTLFEVYGGVGDSVSYHRQGAEIAETAGILDFSVIDQLTGMSRGTAWLVYFTSFFYNFLPPNLLGSFFLFAMLAFIGSLLFYRAYCIAFPESPRAWYIVLVFFLPSILYWPSSLGKDAWVFFCSGVVAFGMVSFIRRAQFWGLFLAAGALLLILLVRPHVAAVMALSLAVGYVLSLKFIARGGFVRWLVATVLICAGGYFALSFSSEYFLGQGLSEASWEEAEEFYQYRQVASATGGSAIAAPSILSPTGLPYAVATVLFRPMIWEAHNFQALLSAGETTFWLWLLWYRRKVFMARIKSMTSDPWVGFCLVYALFMVMALTTAGNLGIIARQRVMLLPFLFMLFG